MAAFRLDHHPGVTVGELDRKRAPAGGICRPV